MTRLAREGPIKNLTKVTLPACEYYLMGKAKRAFVKVTRVSFQL